jgi:hypothetical protein
MMLNTNCVKQFVAHGNKHSTAGTFGNQDNTTQKYNTQNARCDLKCRRDAQCS